MENEKKSIFAEDVTLMSDLCNLLKQSDQVIKDATNTNLRVCNQIQTELGTMYQNLDDLLKMVISDYTMAVGKISRDDPMSDEVKELLNNRHILEKVRKSIKEANYERNGQLPV